METKPPMRPTASQARDSLAALDTDGSSLAERVITPRWYHPALGLLVALLVGAPALPEPAHLTGVAVAAVGVCLLPLVYTRHYGVVTTSPVGTRSRRLLLITLALFVASLAMTLAVKLTGASPWWALAPAATGFAAVVTLGPRYDDALRDEISRPLGEAS